MELVAELLKKKNHTIEVVSQGAVVDLRPEKMPGFQEPEPFDASIPVYYAAALPIRRINGITSALWTLQLFRERHRQKPFDAVIIYNLQFPQALCALYALNRLRLPVILEYEDDAVVDVLGQQQRGWTDSIHIRLVKGILNRVSGCIGVSPHLLSQVPDSVPKTLLRGVVGDQILRAADAPPEARNNWVVFSGTHFRTKGLEQLVQAWPMVNVPGWELHIAGRGEKTERLEEMTRDDKGVKFHGLLNREQNAALLSKSKVGMNPHELSAVPGNVFAFKIVEYLAAGNHVITTPMGALEADLEAGITYIPNNTPELFAKALLEVLQERLYEKTAADAARRVYGPEAVAQSLHDLLEKAVRKAPQSMESIPVAARS
jgi:glycosyltransferase involved in cell wall biosynthesis